MNRKLTKCSNLIEKYGFQIETERRGLYNLIDTDYYLSKELCIGYPYPNYSKDNLTVNQVITYSTYLINKFNTK